MAFKCGVVSFMGWVISEANEWEDYSNYYGEGVEISRNWATTRFLVLEPPVGVSFILLVCYSEHTLRLKV